MKKQFKIIVSLILVVFTLLPVFSIKKLTLWCTDKEKAGIAPVAKLFFKKKKVKIEIDIQAEPRSKFIAAARASVGPDILVGAHDWVGELARNALLAEFNITQEEKNRYWPVAIKGFSYNGKLYGIPYCVEAMILIYNKKLIQNPPKTFEELVPIAKKFTNKSKGTYGFLYGIDNNFYNNFPIIASQGGYIFGFDNKTGRYDVNDIGLANPGAIRGCKFILKLVQEGIVPTSTNNGVVESSFLDGKVAMIIDGPWNTKKYSESLDIGTAKIPSLNGKPAVPFVGARGFMVNAASHDINSAMDFIVNFAGDKAGQLANFNAGGRPPAHKEACKEVMKTNSIVKTVIASVKDGIAMPNVSAMAVVWNYAAGMVDSFKTGDTSVEDAVGNAVKSIKAQIQKRAKKYSY